MKIGLIGLQNSGKTTIFNALTGLDADTASYTTQKIEPNLGIVEVADYRIDKLCEIYKPEKEIKAIIEYIDFVGLTGDSKNDAPFSSSSLALIKNTDALGLVVRNFENEIITQLLEKPNPQKDIELIDSELIITDLIIAENRLEKIELAEKRGIKDAAMQAEKKTLQKAVEHLNNDAPLRTLALTENEDKSIRGFRFMSQKPLMIILNSDENNYGKNENLIFEIEKKNNIIEFAGEFEMELSKLSHEEAKEFMEDLNIKESARKRLTRFSYELMGYISFFTIGKDEVRAWTIRKGRNALFAAGRIHTDLERGFIRAECFSFDDLISAGSEKAIREKGLFRLEGKNYLVQDGDIICIRFNV